MTQRLSLFSQVKYIHFLCKQTRTFSSGKTEILPTQKQQPPFSPFPVPGKYHSTFCLYESGHSKNFISVKSNNICAFLEGLFYLVECLLGSSML